MLQNFNEKEERKRIDVVESYFFKINIFIYWDEAAAMSRQFS